MRRDIFQAIADPTRREIINLIAHRSLNLNELANNFDISRPAVSKHVKILTQCGLINIVQEGRERFCQPKFDKIKEIAVWAEQYEAFWNKKLDALEKFLAREEKGNQHIQSKTK